VKDFAGALKDLINRYSLENASDTPDFILAEYLNACLQAFNTASKNREAWLGAVKLEYFLQQGSNEQHDDTSSHS